MFAVVLDDAELNNLLMTEAIRTIADCIPRAFTQPHDALAFIRSRTDDIGICLVDYDMPEMNGIAVIEAARTVPGFEFVPIVMVTSHTERNLRRAALQAGATDFLAKPFDVIEIKARVSNLLALDRARRREVDRAAWLTREVEAAVAVIEAREREIVTMLVRAAEHRDSDTGDHIRRVSGHVRLIAAALGFDRDRCNLLALASMMHDIGKIGVPDSILLKQGALTPAERREMQLHTERGRRILEAGTSEVARLAAEIAGSHHERWDGTGYPQGLKGEAIPLSGRIMAVADVFDALLNKRPYKKPWSIEEAKAHIAANAGSHFDPACVAAFMARWPEVLQLIDETAVAAPIADHQQWGRPPARPPPVLDGLPPRYFVR